MNIKKMSIKKLVTWFNELERSIFDIGCYSVSELDFFYKIAGELENRGYNCEKGLTKSKWVKEK